MTSKTTVGAAQTEAISLQFAHRLTLVKVELAGIGDVTGVVVIMLPHREPQSL